MRTICALLIVALFVLNTEAQTRRAFIVGIGDYHELRDLKKTVGDAEGYSDVFKNNLDFEVTELINPTRQEFRTGFNQFVTTIQPSDTVAFVFSGHGWSDGAINYLAFSDAPRFVTYSTLREQTVSLNENILSSIKEQRPDVMLAIVDACRNNPFELQQEVRQEATSVRTDLASSMSDENRFERQGLSTKAMSRSLRRVQQVSHETGTLIVYSAGAGEQALDNLSDYDSSKYSVFTRSLLPRLRESRKSLLLSVDEARNEVFQVAGSIGHQQRPAVYSDIAYDYCLGETCAEIDFDSADALWRSISNSSNIGDFEAFISRYSESEHAAKAAERLRQLKADFSPLVGTWLGVPLTEVMIELKIEESGTYQFFRWAMGDEEPTPEPLRKFTANQVGPGACDLNVDDNTPTKMFLSPSETPGEPDQLLVRDGFTGDIILYREMP